MRRHLAAAAALMLIACGPEAALWLRVEAPLQTPTESDALEVEVRAGGATGDGVHAETYALDSDTPFPATLTLYTHRKERTAEALWIQVRALKGAALARPWSSGWTTAQLESGRFVESVVRLCDCP